VICWGSTIPIVREALSLLERSDTALLAFEQLWPLHGGTGEVLARAPFIVSVEGNSTGQLSRLLRSVFGRGADETILKYSGLQFSVEESAERLGAVLSGKGGSR